MVKGRKKNNGNDQTGDKGSIHACLVRLLHGALTVGSFKAVVETSDLFPTIVANHWH
jgi:hypothetical protein